MAFDWHQCLNSKAQFKFAADCAAGLAAAAAAQGQGAGEAWAHFCSLGRAHIIISIQFQCNASYHCGTIGN
eukprot:1142210-Pelagomonas_calceolata.AAC.9